jgi:hypothetical protein
MQRNILWTGCEYNSLENCLVNTTYTGFEINSTIIGKYEGKIYKVEYQIQTNGNWETVFLELKSQHNNQREHLTFKSDAKGNWTADGRRANQFKGCIDVDLPLTPFTNTLPINRLRLNPNEGRQISVIYLDLLEQCVKPVYQKYKRLSETEFQYENVPNDFEAKIEVDELGLVVKYPGLFVRTAILKTDYH